MSTPPGMSSGDPLRGDEPPKEPPPDPPEASSKPDKLTKGTIALGCLGLVVMGILAIVLIGVVASVLGGDDPEGPVPNVVGLKVVDAKEKLDAAGYGTDEEDQSDSLDFNIDNNIVCSTTPGQGETADGDVKVFSRSNAKQCGGELAERARQREEAAQPVDQPFRAEDAAVVALFEQELGDDPDFGDSRVRESACNRITCTVQYNADTPVLSSEKEILNDMRPVFAEPLSDRKLREAKLVPYGETTSVGGKKSVSPLMRITCDRAANREIDWEQIDHEGMKVLCNYTPLVRFE